MSAPVTRAVALIVNPSAGGGRAAKALPAVEARLRGLGRRRSHVDAHARPRARARAGAAARRGAGEVAVTLGGDGLVGAVAGALRAVPDAIARRPARAAAATTSRARSGIPLRPARPRATCSPHGRAARDRPRRGRRHGRSSASRSLGFDSDANRIANEAPARLRRRSSTSTARCARWSRGSRPRFDRRASTASARRSPGYASPRRTPAYGGGMFLAPDAELDDGAARRRPDSARRPSCASCAACRRSSRARTSTSPRSHVLRGARGARRRRPPVHGLRRRRPDRRAAVHRPRRCPDALRVLVPRMSAARRQGRGRARRPARCRGAPGAAARRCPARCSCASSRTRSARLAARLARGSAVISATNGKTTTAAMVAVDPRARRARGSSTTAPARTWPAASRPRCMGGRARRGDPGLFEVDEFWLGRVVDELRPRALLLGNLFRDQLDRYGELETIADRWAGGRRRARRRALVLNADDPLVADLGRERDRRPSTSASRTTRWRSPAMQHAADSKHCRRCGAPYRLRRRLPRPPRPLPLPTAAGRSRPEPAGRRHATSSSTASAAPRSRCAPRGRARRRAPAARPLQRLQRARRRGAGARARRAARRRRRRPATPSRRRSAAPRRCASRGRELSILLVKNPAGANEVLRTLALEDGEHDLLGVLNDRIADGRDVSLGVGRRLRAARRRACGA